MLSLWKMYIEVCWKDWRQERGWQRDEIRLDSITDSMNTRLSSSRQWWRTREPESAASPSGVAKSQTCDLATEQHQNIQRILYLRLVVDWKERMMIAVLQCCMVSIIQHEALCHDWVRSAVWCLWAGSCPLQNVGSSASVHHFSLPIHRSLSLIENCGQESPFLSSCCVENKTGCRVGFSHFC